MDMGLLFVFGFIALIAFGAIDTEFSIKKQKIKLLQESLDRINREFEMYKECSSTLKVKKISNYDPKYVDRLEWFRKMMEVSLVNYEKGFASADMVLLAVKKAMYEADHKADDHKADDRADDHETNHCRERKNNSWRW